MITIRNVREEDHMVLCSLARRCPPLDIHTAYTYWVNSKFHGSSSYILEDENVPIGYIMMIETPTKLFVWQIGILSEYRRRNLSAMLIECCVQYAQEANKNIEVTIAEDNKASYNAFSRYCEKHSLNMSYKGVVNVLDGDGNTAEVENLYLIGIK